MAVATMKDEALERTRSADDCPDCLAENLSWLLTQAHFNLVSEIAVAFEPLGVSNRGYHVLATAKAGEYTQKELAEKIGLDKTTMVVTVDELERAGLAERIPSSADRRARVISVTKTGERKVRQGQEIVERIQNDVLTSLSSRDRKVFLEALGSLVKGRLSEPCECSPPLRRREPRP
jgi:MarR family transcriptional regulator, transcriptional regulator for hemolysin